MSKFRKETEAEKFERLVSSGSSKGSFLHLKDSLRKKKKKKTLVDRYMEDYW